MRLCSVPNCGGKHNCRGYCRKHYSRLQRIGYVDDSALQLAPAGTHLAFIKSIIDTGPTNTCILWPYKLIDKDGYGVMVFGGNTTRAHRVALCLLTNTNPRGVFATHGPCNNRLCVNPWPEHGMRWGSPKDNRKDMERDDTVLRGERNHEAKLTADEVLEIRRLWSQNNPPTQRELSIRFGVSKSHISNVITRRVWGHL